MGLSLQNETLNKSRDVSQFSHLHSQLDTQKEKIKKKQTNTESHRCHCET